MATIGQSSPSTLQPVINSLYNLQIALQQWGASMGFTNQQISITQANAGVNNGPSDAYTNNALYIQWQGLNARVQLLLSNIINSQSVRQIQVRGGSLYYLAAQFYGDVNQAFGLMEFNDLPTPRLSDTLVQDIYIPQAITVQAATGVSFAQVTPVSTGSTQTGTTLGPQPL